MTNKQTTDNRDELTGYIEKQEKAELSTKGLDEIDIDQLIELDSSLSQGASKIDDPQKLNSWHSDDAQMAAKSLILLRESLKQQPQNAIPFGIPRQLAQYQLLELVGTGGFAMVFKAKDLNLNRIVAVKIPKPHVVISVELREKFLNEARTAARLEHLGIVMTMEAGLDQELPFIIYSFCEGPTLAEWLKVHSIPVNPTLAAEIVISLTDAVEYSHQQGILHRDIKPANVLMFPKPEKQSITPFPYIPKLTDFGLAKVTQAGLDDTSTSLVLGTPLYLAPEMISGEEDAMESFAIDIYGLGLILYELLTLHPPFDDRRLVSLLLKIQSETPQPLQSHAAGIPIDLNTICQKCLRKNPVERYQSAAMLKEDLQNFLQGQQINATQPGWYEIFKAWAQHPMRVYEAGMLLLISTVGITVWMIQGIFQMMLQNAEGANLQELIMNSLQLICSISIPHIIGGIRIIHGKRFWMYVSIIISSFGLILSLGGFIGVTIAYPEVYQYHPVARVLVFSMMAIIFLTQIFWLSIVIWGKQLPVWPRKS